MPERKRKRRFFDLFGFGEDDFLFRGKATPGGSGYSISITYDAKNKPVVHVETHGEVDTTELRRDIEQRYPGAKIEGLEKKPLIRVIDEREEKKSNNEKKR